MGTLKLRDMKLQDRNLRHKNAGVETARHGISGTKMQGWKLRDMESAAQKCRGGNCEIWNQRHKNAGVEIARHGICGTKMQGWKLRDMESAAQKCRGGNCGTTIYGKPKLHLLQEEAYLRCLVYKLKCIFLLYNFY